MDHDNLCLRDGFGGDASELEKLFANKLMYEMLRQTADPAYFNV